MIKYILLSCVFFLNFTACEDIHEGEVVWKFQTKMTRSGIPSNGSPAVKDGNVYVSSKLGIDSFCAAAACGKLYCLDGKTGIARWVLNLGCSFCSGRSIVGTPIISDDFLYVSIGSKICCLEAGSGRILWESSDVVGTPAISDGFVYITVGSKINCLNAQTGEKIWEFQMDNLVGVSPAVADGCIYVGSSNYLGSGNPSATFYCLKADTGERNWEFKADNYFESSPAVADGYVFFGCIDGNFYCLDAKTGEKYWEYRHSNGVWSAPAALRGCVYFGGYGGISCFDIKTGKKIWKFETGSDENFAYSLAVTERNVYVGSTKRKVYCLNAETGEKVWEFKLLYGINSAPAVANGYVYLGAYGYVYCLKAADGDNGTWPMYKGNPTGTGTVDLE